MADKVKSCVSIQEGLDYRGLGGLVKRLIHPKTVGSANLGVSILFLNPGETVKKHSHPYEEAYFVLQGEGTMWLGDDTIQLHKYLSVYIPSDFTHGQMNTGCEPLIILCSLTPPPDVW